jgi:hypothetical protein
MSEVAFTSCRALIGTYRLSLLEVRPTYIIAFHGGEGKAAADEKVAEPHTANSPTTLVHIPVDTAVRTAVLYPWDSRLEFRQSLKTNTVVPCGLP